MLLESGQLVLGREYRVEGLIGEGPFTRVYRGTHIDLLSPRALKVVPLDLPGLGPTEIEAYRRRFRRQTQLGAQLAHQNLIHVEEYRQEGNALILVMEYAAGKSLADRIRSALDIGHSIPIDQVLSTAMDVGAGLAAIHALGTAHGNVKPSNVLYDNDGVAKLTDLGPALVPGEPVNLSAQDDTFGGAVTSQADVTDLGAVLFEMLTGRTVDKVPRGTRVRALRTDVPAWLDDLIMLLLEEDPVHGPRSGSEFLDYVVLSRQAAASSPPETPEWLAAPETSLAKSDADVPEGLVAQGVVSNPPEGQVPFDLPAPLSDEPSVSTVPAPAASGPG